MAAGTQAEAFASEMKQTEAPTEVWIVTGPERPDKVQ